jgi:hypothetical protein
MKRFERMRTARPRAALILLAAVILLCGQPVRAAMDCSDPDQTGKVALHSNESTGRPGSFANPWINRHHVFCGEINRRGKAVGFHHRPGGENPRAGPGGNNPAAARITGTIKPLEGAPGWRIYRGEGIEIWNGRSERYVPKASFSSFFPDNCTPAEVLASIRHAVMHANRRLPAKGGRFRGMSGPADATEGYCYLRDSASAPPRPFPMSGFLNNLKDAGWTINTAYPQ